LGDAELGLQLLKRSKHSASTRDPRTKKHLYPEPRLALGQWLAEKHIASAMMDLSDGLSADLPRLCAASGVGARIENSRMPLVQDAAYARKQGLDPLRLALHGGDDYELLFTVPPRKERFLPSAFRGAALTPIGRITQKAELLLCEKGVRERPLPSGGWDPFRKAW
jgi:thiamine-monophosphate kinase